MALYSRKGWWQFEGRWQGWPRLRLSLNTKVKKVAEAMAGTLMHLHKANRRDLLEAIRGGQLTVAEVHDLWVSDRRAELQARLDALTRPATDEPALGPLVDEWLAWLAKPSTVAWRTKRPYASTTVTQYREKWALFWEYLPGGRETRLSDLTTQLLEDYKDERLSETACELSTINRDFNAMQSFEHWLGEKKGLFFPRLRYPKSAEAGVIPRWLTTEEITALEGACDPAYWPVFATCLYTGGRSASEVLPLQWQHVLFREGVIRFTPSAVRRFKTLAATRDVFLAPALKDLLLSYRAGVPHQPTDPVFPGPVGHYRAVFYQWTRALERSKIPHARLHDLRHTFAVHLLMGGASLGELQAYLGHSTPHMTLRYAKVVPSVDHHRQNAARLTRAFGSAHILAPVASPDV